MNETDKTSTFPPKVRGRAVGRVVERRGDSESEWAIGSIVSKMGCTAEALRKWVRPGERDRGEREGMTASERERLKAREHEDRERKRAHEILRLASAFFAQAERDRLRK